jgi:hypothetical protein
LLERSAEDAARRGPVYDLLKEHASLPSGAALALRFMGAVHRLVLEGRAPDLARFYPSVGGDSDDLEAAWRAFRDVVAGSAEELRPLLDSAVQTNEVGRAAGLLGGFLEVSRRAERPLRLLEIGSSGGLNLLWDRFHYDAGPAGTWGPADSPVHLDGFESAPDLGIDARIAERAGCDPDPIDERSEEGRLTLSSYLWADQLERWARLQGALDLAGDANPPERSGAAEWLRGRLAEVRPGQATVVFHSIVWQYMAPDEQAEVERLIIKAGERATPDAPVAWLYLEPPAHGDDVSPGHLAGSLDFTAERAAPDDLAEVRLSLWPGARSKVVAHCGYHGRPVRWFGWDGEKG